MATILDIVGSFVIFGIVMLTIARIQVNLNQTVSESSFNIINQRNAIELARQLEFDLVKIGYRSGTRKLLLADTSRIAFKSDLKNSGSVDSVAYALGTADTMTQNPRDFFFYRRDNTSTIRQQWGMTKFYVTYHDSTGRVMATPITNSDSLAKVRSLNVRFIIESKEPIINAVDTSKPVYFAVDWQKLIFPRNLSSAK